MHRFLSKITVALVVVMLLGAAGIVALLHELARHALQSNPPTEGGTLLLVLVALGLTAIVVGVVVVSRFLRSGSRRDGPRRSLLGKLPDDKSSG